MSYYDGQMFGQTNRGTNHRLGPDPEGYPPEWDRPERPEAVMPTTEHHAWIEHQRANAVFHRGNCVDAEGTLDCVCSLGNPGDPIPTPTKENR